MKSTFVICVAIILFISCGSQEKSIEMIDHKKLETSATDTSNYTQIKWKDTIVKFGKQSEGKEVKIVFDFENIGNKPLTFSSVRPACGCTIAEYPKQAFVPNEKGQIIATYQSKNRGKGLVNKTVFVEGNFNHSPIVLTFIGEIY